MNAKETRELVLEKVRDLTRKLIVDDRKEDKTLPLGAIEDSMADHVHGVRLWEMIDEFDKTLRSLIPVPVEKPAEKEEE